MKSINTCSCDWLVDSFATRSVWTLTHRHQSRPRMERLVLVFCLLHSSCFLLATGLPVLQPVDFYSALSCCLSLFSIAVTSCVLLVIVVLLSVTFCPLLMITVRHFLSTSADYCRVIFCEVLYCCLSLSVHFCWLLSFFKLFVKCCTVSVHFWWCCLLSVHFCQMSCCLSACASCHCCLFASVNCCLAVLLTSVVLLLLLFCVCERERVLFFNFC